MITPHQAKYFAFNLTKQNKSSDSERLGQGLLGAKVDMNPHQIEASLFALNSRFSDGVILADEVGLGKTIEAGLVISQKWAEGQRSMLIIAPKSLRHQWKAELKNLFGLESEVVDGQRFRKMESASEENIFDRKERLLITNEHFIDNYSSVISKNHWDLIVIDEAHKLRNVWRKGKSVSKRAKAIRDAIQPFKKLLLTATPMQNNLMELYGLTTFIDPYLLGTADSFAQRYCNIPEEIQIERLAELKHRLRGAFHRELRKNIREYIQYTNRNAVTITYNPDDLEEELRIKFEDFLRRPRIISVPPSALPLLKLIYLKLLASSTFALKNSLLNLYKRLLLICADTGRKELYEELFDNLKSQLTLPDGRRSEELEKLEKSLFKNVFPKTFEGLAGRNHAEIDEEEILKEDIEFPGTLSDEEAETLDQVDAKDQSDDDESITEKDIREEAEIILNFILLGRQIKENTKASALEATIQQQFEKARSEGWPEKAVIFTEFRTTQNYVVNCLKNIGLELDRDIVVFNGDSGDVEQRKQLVDSFKNSKKIFLTTEAGAEGLNLQFCNLLINYDLPWNPQRIEQRIGRCHRYGQKFDVVVVNFVNEKNIADVRVLELLQDKFSLFKGAFGASDEVLGAIEMGDDIEQKILDIYMSCRTQDEIESAFNNLKSKYKPKIDQKILEARKLVLENFDEDVHSKLKMRLEQAKSTVSSFQKQFFEVLRFGLGEEFEFNEDRLELKSKIDNRFFSLGGESEGNLLRLDSPTAQKAIKACKTLELQPSKLVFEVSKYPHKLSKAEGLIGKSGELTCCMVKFKSFQDEEYILTYGIHQSGVMDQDEVDQLLKCEARHETCDSNYVFDQELEKGKDNDLKSLLSDLERRNSDIFNEQIEKLDQWATDIKTGLELEIKGLDQEIRAEKVNAKKAPNLDEKVKAQRKVKSLETKRNQKRRELHEAQDRVDNEKEELLEKIEQSMKLEYEKTNLFKIKWEAR
ncbi:MAG: hypothetical protein CL676_04015 [Bdellovibrionaceae bacterium]|nr:hypothetical protein [Pseudobdellovibrionaceae bacterium]